MTGRVTGRPAQTRVRRSACAPQGKIARLLSGWKVETIAFSLGIRGSYKEDKWQADLEKFKVPGPTIAALM